MEKGEAKTSGEVHAARTGHRRPKGAAAGAAWSGLQMPGVTPGAKLAPAARLKYSLGPFELVGSDRGLKARRWSLAGSGMLRVAPFFGGAGPSELSRGRRPELRWRCLRPGLPTS